MSTDPDLIRTQIAALLADLPDIEAGVDAAGPPTGGNPDIDIVAARLEEAHELLVKALESVERG
jgi:hypothetical protein